MFFDLKKLFDSVYKKNKAATVAILAMLIFALVEIIIVVGHRYASILDFTQDQVIIHESRLNSIEKKMVTQDVFSRDVIKRSSFNSYIKRKDVEYHEQVAVNSFLSSKIGFLEGEVGMFYGMFKPINVPRITNGAEDNE